MKFEDSAVVYQNNKRIVRASAAYVYSKAVRTCINLSLKKKLQRIAKHKTKQ